MRKSRCSERAEELSHELIKTHFALPGKMIIEAEMFLLLEMKPHDTPERGRARPRAREGEREKKRDRISGQHVRHILRTHSTC